MATEDNVETETLIPRATAISIPAADLSVDVSEDEPLTTTQTFPVKQPEEYSTDFMVQVYASTLTKCRNRLIQIQDIKFPFGELLLGVATAFLGALMGALASEIKLESFRGILFFCVLPALGLASLVGFFFFRYWSLQKPAQIVKEVLGELPDPERTKNV